MLKPITDITIQTLKAWWNHDVFRFAAAIAFYTVFSLAPILVISLGMASLVFSEEKAKEQIVQEIETLTGPEGAKVTRQVFQNTDIMRRNPMAIVFGLIALLVGSTAVFADLQQSLNQIWQVKIKSQRSTWKTLVGVRMRSFGIVLAVGFMLLVSMVFSALLNGFQNMISDQMQGVAWFWSLLNTLVSFGLITLLFAMIYKYLPDVKIAWRHVMVGAALTSVLYSIGKYLIGYYLGTVAIASSYGAAGSFVILLIWIYYSALICFFGAEFTHVFAKWSGERIVPEPYAENAPAAGSEDVQGRG